ncbi:MAG: TIGR00266 family protein [Cardiobacteriaceae bacterium]|nr:TIGR00266 family protein [Cardiobacteriaceae bacterium]
MPNFSIIGENDPFLHVSLQAGESIACESNAMVMMEDNLDLVGEMSGGFLSALTRSLANGESFFQQRIRATRGAGDCLLAPALPGSIEILEVGKQQYFLSDDAYMAASDGVDLTVRTQSIGNALFGGTGGFFIGQTSGAGKIAVSGFGSVFSIEVTPNKPVTIDNGHVVAWDSHLHYELSLRTSQNGGGMLSGMLGRAASGLLGNTVNSLTSGEGIVLKFSGAGKIILCSRNKGAFLSWLSGQRPQ